jgi:RHS repeat-associated protein
LEQITGPTGETLKYRYEDALENLTRVIYGNNTVKQMSYRPTDNRLGTTTLPSGETITYEYDSARRVESETTKTAGGTVIGTVSYTYENGNIKTVTDGTGTTTYRYDPVTGALKGIDYPNGSSIDYTYDLLGRLKTIAEKASVTATASVTTYDYDAFGNLKWVLDPAGGLTTMVYDDGNRLKERRLPNGVTSFYDYDDLDRVKSIVHKNAAGNVLASVTYERKGIGEPTKITREDGSYVMLEYDAALRVKKESYYNASGALQDETTYTYDAAGKRLVQSSTVSGDRNFTYKPGYQLDSIGGAVNEDYDYDTNGRLTYIARDGKTLDLEHDAGDRLTAVENETNGSTIQYTYDGQGRRVAATEGTSQRRFLVAPAMGSGLESTDLIADGNSNLITNYIYAGGTSPFMRLDASGNPVYYLTDAMGSAIGLADGTGAEVGDFRYDSFGNLRSASGAAAANGAAGGDFRFQGQWLEQGTGIYHFRARDYDPKTGMFLSRDPVDIIETEPESFNPYQFVYNNPYIYSDPTGMFTIAELNSVQKIQDNLLSYAGQQATAFLRQKTGEMFSNIALDVIEKLLPGTFDGDTLFNWADELPDPTGGLFEDFLQDNLCPLLPSVLSKRLWLTPEIDPNGVVHNPGFNCGSPGSKVHNLSNPDFLFEEGSPKPVQDNNPLSYLIGDVKLTVTQAHDSMKKPSKQWQAMANHAEKYQALPLTAYITFRWTVNKTFSQDPTYVTTALKDMQRIAIKKNQVTLFVVNISSR